MRWLLLLLALCLPSPALAQSAPRRFALLVGSNDGGPRRGLLRYAQTDAESVARVLGELGGVASSDQFLLRDPDVQALSQAWEQLRQRVVGASPGSAEVIFYYSGHSDQRGLLLGGETFSYERLRATLDAMPARVRVGILDSCASGAIARGLGGGVRSKGGSHLQPLMSSLSTDVRGYALLASASADEDAQESDLLGGSFFTQALVTGLRGAADLSGDGLVTLGEAYDYAAQATLFDTERTDYGPQHAAYDMQLAGTSELVLTDLRATGASLGLPRGEAARAFVRDGAGRLVAELLPEHAVALAPAGYQITLREGARWAELRIDLRQGERRLIDASGLTWREGTPTQRRGAAHFMHWPVRLNTLATRADPLVIDHVAINLLFGRCAHLYGLSLGAGGMLVDGDASGVMVSAGTNLVGDDSAGLLVAGGLNLVHDNVRAWQIAGGANLVGGYARGFLLSPGLNRVMGPSSGLQVATVNMAHRLDGVQVGVVNIGQEVHGVQLGVVNLGESGGISLGVLNLFREGRHHLYVTSSTREPVALELQLGQRAVYNVLGAGLMADGHVSARWGIAGAVPLTPRDRLEPAIMGAWTGARGVLVQGRVVWGRSLGERARLFIGPSWDLWVPVAEGAAAPGWGPLDSGETLVQGLGGVAGLGLSF